MAALVGVVDGVVNGELCGWIANPEATSRFEPVICHGNGRTLTFVPFSFREDVVTAIGQEGVFGFAIALDLLTALGPQATVTDRFGTVLQHGEAVPLPPPPARKAQGPVRIFLHIPKTAGTSLRNTLLRDVPAGECLLLYPGHMPGISTERSLQVPLCHRNRLSWIYGHIPFGYHAYLTRPARYVSFVREPMARLRSNFDHHAAAGTEFDIRGTIVRPSVMINEGICEEFDNVMTRVLAGLGADVLPLGKVGEDEVELALHNVREYFDFIGLYEQAEADTLGLQQLYGMDAAPLSRDNITPSERRYTSREIASVDWQAVDENNAADRLLYERLQRERLVSRALG